jgi:F-type H+-transporting ATPase subunit b
MVRNAPLALLLVAVMLVVPNSDLRAQSEDSHGTDTAASHNEAADHDQAATHGEGQGEGAAHGSANPIVWATDLALWTLIVFVVLLFVLRRFAWGPLTSALDAREASIRKSIEDADNARLEAQRLLDEHQKKLDAVKDEVRAILDEARRDAQHTSQQIQREAQEEARAIRDRSRREIEQARDQALKEIYDHLTGLVTMTAGRVLRRELNPADHQRLVEEALAEFSGQSAS